MPPIEEANEIPSQESVVGLSSTKMLVLDVTKRHKTCSITKCQNVI